MSRSGVIEKLGAAVTGYEEGQRVIAGAITSSGYSNACLCDQHSQDGAGTRHGFRPLGGWRFGKRSTVAKPNTCWCPTR
jgi:threonine dehydrogenase-like Zn-dependent dehydrogenase